MSLFPNYIQQFNVYKDELTVYTSPSTLISLMRYLRDHIGCQFKQLQDVCGVDYPTKIKSPEDHSFSQPSGGSDVKRRRHKA